MQYPPAQSPYLLELARKGKPLPLDGDNLHLVQGLIKSQMIALLYAPNDGDGTLHATITAKGESFLKWLSQPD